MHNNIYLDGGNSGVKSGTDEQVPPGSSSHPIKAIPPLLEAVQSGHTIARELIRSKGVVTYVIKGVSFAFVSDLC
jgi:hypothetical protein